MIKQRAYDINQTNIANIGSELDHKVKAASAGKEPAWAKCGTTAGTWVWRIENFHVVPVPEVTVGKFFDGDAYIVLHSVKGAGDELHHTIHFWLGDQCSQDEAGTAAYKTVELDDFLGGKATQYREIRGGESATFASIFPNFTILHGGIESGFHHVKPEDYEPRLLHFHGDKKHMFVEQVELSGNSLNTGDVFLLDFGLELIQWNGGKSNGTERVKAAQYGAALEHERDGKAKVTVYTEGDSGLEKFWSTLGGVVAPKPPIVADKPNRSKSIWDLSDASGKLEFKQIATGTIAKSMLKPDDCYVVDGGVTVFAWVGKSADAAERKAALDYAHKYLEDQKLPVHTSIVRVVQGSENAEFNACFH